jgi:hypothetical protein
MSEIARAVRGTGGKNPAPGVREYRLKASLAWTYPAPAIRE